MAAVRRLTGVRFESLSGAVVETLPSPFERVAAVTAGTPRQVIGALLDGANLGYILVSPPGKPDEVKTVVLTSNPQSQRAKPVSSTGPGMPMPQAVGRPPVRPRPPEPQEEDETTPLPAAETTQNQQMPIPPPGAPGQNAFGSMSGQQGPPPTPPGANTGQPQSQPRTPAEMLQMLQQQRNQNRAPDSSQP